MIVPESSRITGMTLSLAWSPACHALRSTLKSPVESAILTLFPF